MGLGTIWIFNGCHSQTYKSMRWDFCVEFGKSDSSPLKEKNTLSQATRCESLSFSVLLNLVSDVSSAFLFAC